MLLLYVLVILTYFFKDITTLFGLRGSPLRTKIDLLLHLFDNVILPVVPKSQ